MSENASVAPDLHAALADALEGLQEMLPYVPESLAVKWDLAGYIARAKTALGEPS